jgi:uncharacterized protein (TIGR00645 family)
LTARHEPMTASAARSALRSSSPEPAPSGELGPPCGKQGDEPHRPGRPTRFETRFERLLGGSRYLVMVPVVVLVATALGAFAYGAYSFAHAVQNVIDNPFPAEANIAGLLIVIDLFLIGATMLIAAIGFYELFISRVDPPGARPLPPWLLMQDLNDLKARVIAMIVLVAAVSFIQVLVDFRSGLQVLELGGGVGFVIAALTGFLRFGGQKRGEE